MNLVFFANDVEGGVVSFIRYITYENIYYKFSIKVIATSNITNKKYSRINSSLFNKKVEFILFPFSPLENRYNVLNRLKKLIDVNDVLISDGGVELEMCSVFKLNNPLIYILHGDYSYYYDQAVYCQKAIDRFITINKGMALHLKELIPARKKNIFQQWPAVPAIFPKTVFNETGPLKILFAGLIDEGKGAFDLPLIDEIIRNENVDVCWTIIGQGEIEKLKESWKNKTNVTFTGLVENTILLEEYKNHDIIILPSRAESLGLVVAEGMKAGLVPLVTNFKTGVSEFIVNKQNGFLIEIGDIKLYAETIKYLNSNRNILRQIGTNAINTANKLFDPEINVQNYLKLISETLPKREGWTCIYPKSFSRMDNKWIPNFITIFIRKIFY
jgi:glycosyltransferase involved in cell wall biosynthesis